MTIYILIEGKSEKERERERECSEWSAWQVNVTFGAGHNWAENRKRQALYSTEYLMYTQESQ